LVTIIIIIIKISSSLVLSLLKYYPCYHHHNHHQNITITKEVFGSVVMVAVQSVFCSEIYQNNVFLVFFFKLTSTHQKNLKIKNKLFLKKTRYQLC